MTDCGEDLRFANSCRSRPGWGKYYRKTLLGQALGGIGMKVVSASRAQPWGVTFGITGTSRVPGTFVSEMEHDWDRVRSRLTPLVSSVLAAIP